MEILDKKTNKKLEIQLDIYLNGNTYLIYLDKNINKQIVTENIIRICETLKNNLCLYRYEIINPYIIRGYT